MQNKDIQPIPQELQVLVPEKLRAGVYSNVVNINVGPGEVTLNFVYANPNDNPNGTLVSRVIISRDAAAQISELLKQVIATANEVDPR